METTVFRRFRSNNLSLFMCSASKDCCRCTWPWDPGELLRKCEAFFDFARFIGTEPLETTTTRGACMSPG